MLEQISRYIEHYPHKDRCFYCGSDSPHYQMDHWPVPKRRGGTTLVRACKHCHNLKDRTSDSMFDDYLFSQQWMHDGICHCLHGCTLNEKEVLWSCGEWVPLTYKAVWGTFDDWPDIPAPVRLAIARQVADCVNGQGPVLNYWRDDDDGSLFLRKP